MNRTSVIVAFVTGLLTGSGGLLLGVWDRLYPPNNPPVASLILHPNEGDTPLSVAMIASASDPEGKELTYQWRIDDKEIADSSSSHIRQFKTGRYAINLKVEDSEGLIDDDSGVVTVRDAFDRTSFWETDKAIRQWLKNGEYLQVLKLTDNLRHNCDSNSIPHVECAGLHDLAAQAQMKLGRYSEGLDSINSALAMKPDYESYIILRVEFHLMKNDYASVIADLDPLAERFALSTKIAIYLAISLAMESKFEQANVHLASAISTSSPRMQVAKLVRVIISGLDQSTSGALDASTVEEIVCGANFPRQDIVHVGGPYEPHIHGLKMLMKELDNANQKILATVLETKSCL